MYDELRRHFGRYDEVSVTLDAVMNTADADGSGEIEGAEVVHVMEVFVPETLLVDSRVRKVILRLAWCV
jgi:hypothetical protein